MGYTSPRHSPTSINKVNRPMKIFLDTADVAEIREYAASGLVDGVTTNPSLAAKTGRDYVESLKEICSIVPGAVSAEVLAMDYDGMIREAAIFTKIAKNIAVKVPLTWPGLKACKTLSDQGTMVNVTLCFSPVQAMMAAKAGRRSFALHRPRRRHGRRRHRADPRHPHPLRQLQLQDRDPGRVGAPCAACARIGPGGGRCRHHSGVCVQVAVEPSLTDKGLAAFEADAKKAGVVIKG